MCLGLPGRIVAITHAEHLLGLVDVMGAQQEINLACIVSDERPLQACIGDWVLVHLGFAMRRIDEREAQLTLQVLQQLGEAQAELQAMRAGESPPRTGQPMK
jgi:hydrogenase expression/formation protein HypC